MEAQDVRDVFTKILPEEALTEVIQKTRFQERERKLQALQLLRAMIIAACTGYGGRQRDAMRLYFESGAQKVARGAFYSWFGPPLERVMEAVRDLAFAYANSLPKDLPGLLGSEVRDWHIYDSTTVSLEKDLSVQYPGAGDYAALKIHKRFSVGLGTLIGYHISPAKDHDSKHLLIDESWRGLGLLCDLGYASLQRLQDCETNDVRYVIRLKENWKPKVEKVLVGEVAGKFAAGADFDLLLEREVILLKGKPLDAQVTLGRGGKQVRCRLVGVRLPQGGYGLYLTNLPESFLPEHIGMLYRVRWEIEGDNKLDKSCLRLSEIGARTGPAVRALIHASMVGAMMVCLLAHHHRLREAPPARAGMERKSPPIHPMSLAKMVGVAAMSIARALSEGGEYAQKEWERLAQLFSTETDPNWRRNPSVLDQLRGWKISPGRPRKPTASSVALN